MSGLDIKKRDGLADKCRDMGVDDSEFTSEEFRPSKNRQSVGGKIKHAAGAVVKGTAVVAGLGVLGVMAGATAIATKGKQKNDEIAASFGDSMSYCLSRFLGGNDHMYVSRLESAGRSALEGGMSKKAARKLPPMPVMSCNQMQQGGPQF